jgi:regulator of cell morphogenesis and NO signaling
MTRLDTRTTVGQLVAERPARARVFERYGIDYCCGGKTPLDEACAGKSLDVEAVVRELDAPDEAPAMDQTDWTRAPLGELIDHIVATHHAYLQQQLPRLAAMANKVVDVHGERHPELNEVRAVFEELAAELESHLGKEEQILFPMIKELEASATAPCFHCGSVNNPIRVMEHEHDRAGDALARIRELTRDYSPPSDACNTYRTLLTELAALETDLHQHIHKENNILFPRAAAMEAGKRT